MSARPGDVILEHDGDFPDRLIQFGQAISAGPKRSHWNHVMLGSCYDADGNLLVIEATGSGVVEDRLLAPGRGELQVVAVEPAETRARAVIFARARLGDKYGWGTIASIVLTILTGSRIRFGLRGAYICSGLVASALTFGGVEMGDDPEWAWPADLDRPSFAAS